MPCDAVCPCDDRVRCLRETGHPGRHAKHGITWRNEEWTRLRDAAPELAEALEGLVKAIEEAQETYDYPEPDVIERARAALRKAGVK